ncbi:MAG: EAL domain-containing protein [Acidobacteriota bacterium]|nr:EAL domain-containing protein [Acidobacteriota bacterium]
MSTRSLDDPAALRRQHADALPEQPALDELAAQLARENAALRRELAEQQHALDTLHAQGELARDFFENAHDIFYTHDLKGDYTFLNKAGERITGYTREEAMSLNLADLVVPEYLDRVREMLARKLKEGIETYYEVEIMTKERRRLTLEVSSRLLSRDGQPIGIQGIARDITQRKRAEAALRESEERYRELFENANDIIYTHDLKGNFTSLNKAGERITGYTREEVLSLNVADLVAPEHLPLARQMISRKASERVSTVYELEIMAKGGQRVTLEASTQLIYEDGRPAGIQGVARDITERKVAAERLRHDAYHDALTGLPNRLLLADHLRLAIERAKRYPAHLFAVLFMDIDRFKNINDSLGHTVGDELLIAIAGRLEKCLRPGDTVARLGGDEFTILLDGISGIADAIRVAERVQLELMMPFSLGGGRDVFTTASVGIASSTLGYERPEDILRDADAAMYRAKMLGKARHAIFDKSMHERALTALQLESDMRRAIEREEFRIEYQPIISLQTGQLSGFESLVRWQHPTRGLINPAEFIPVAEETGLIVPLGLWVLRAACEQMQSWQRRCALFQSLTLSVNLSGKQLAQPDLFEQMYQVLRDIEIAPDCLQLEITESVIMENAEEAIEMLTRLKELKLRLTIDDFGTGYSSLSYLHRFPVDMLKIDRSFVSRMIGSAENAEIVRTIITLANNLNMAVIAEGVETAEQLSRLRDLRCEYGQGYFFANPLDDAAAEALLKQHPRWL